MEGAEQQDEEYDESFQLALISKEVEGKKLW